MKIIHLSVFLFICTSLFFAHVKAESLSTNNTFYPSLSYIVDTADCVRFACDKLGMWGCDSKSKLLEVHGACAGNLNRHCAQEACSLLGEINCNEREEVLSVVKSCRGNYGAVCLLDLCSKAGSLGCNEFSEIFEITKSCGVVSKAP